MVYARFTMAMHLTASKRAGFDDEQAVKDYNMASTMFISNYWWWWNTGIKHRQWTILCSWQNDNSKLAKNAIKLLLVLVALYFAFFCFESAAFICCSAGILKDLRMPAWHSEEWGMTEW
jgi:hypothetical protein